MLNTHKFICLLLFLAFRVSSENSEILQCQYDPVFAAVDSFSVSDKTSWKRINDRYISPYLLYQKVSKGLTFDSFVIDTRSKKDFEKHHIKGAINLPATSLKTKSFFKRKQIILVGQGDDYHYLEIFYENLKRSGFDNIAILDGGMNYWKSKIETKTLMHDEYMLSDLSKIISGDIGKWKIIDASKNTELTKQFPNVISLTDRKSINNPLSFVKTLINQEGLIENLLLVLPQDPNNEQLVQLWQSKLKANVYLIEATKMAQAVKYHNQKQRLVSHKKRADGLKMTCL